MFNSGPDFYANPARERDPPLANFSPPHPCGRLDVSPAIPPARPTERLTSRFPRILTSLDIEPENVKEKGRLSPGKMLLVDTKAGRIVRDDEVKRAVAGCQPYAEWVKREKVDLATTRGAPGS